MPRGIGPDVLAGVVIGLAIILLGAFLRAGVAAWTALAVAMVTFSNQPDSVLIALTAAGGAWLLVRLLLPRRAGPQ